MGISSLNIETYRYFCISKVSIEKQKYRYISRSNRQKVKSWYLFSFIPIISKFCFNKFPFYGLLIPEKHTQKHSELTSLQHFEIDISKNFQKWKFSFFSIFSKFVFSDLCLGSSDRLTNYSDVLKSVGKVVEKC